MKPMSVGVPSFLAMRPSCSPGPPVRQDWNETSTSRDVQRYRPGSIASPVVGASGGGLLAVSADGDGPAPTLLATRRPGD